MAAGSWPALGTALRCCLAWQTGRGALNHCQTGLVPLCRGMRRWMAVSGASSCGLYLDEAGCFFSTPSISALLRLDQQGGGALVLGGNAAAAWAFSWSCPQLWPWQLRAVPLLFRFLRGVRGALSGWARGAIKRPGSPDAV